MKGVRIYHGKSMGAKRSCWLFVLSLAITTCFCCAKSSPVAVIEGGNSDITVIGKTKILDKVNVDSARIVVSDSGHLTIQALRSSYTNAWLRSGGYFYADSAIVASFLVHAGGESTGVQINFLETEVALFSVDSQALLSVYKTVAESIQVAVSGSKSGISLDTLSGGVLALEASESGMAALDTVHVNSFSAELDGQGTQVAVNKVQCNEAEIILQNQSRMAMGRATISNLVAHVDSASVRFDQILSDSVSAVLRGNGQSVLMSGQIQSHAIEQWDGANYYAAGTATRHAVVTMHGSGSVLVRVSDTLEVKMEGTGNVLYYGNPVVTITGSGTGNVIKAE